MNRLLIVGFGDIAQRTLPALASQFAVTALVRPQHAPTAPSVPGVRVTPGDLDDPASLTDVGAEYTDVVHLAPPPVRGSSDPRTMNLLAALARAPRKPRRIVYISTSGVYGNCDGAWIDEQRPLNPHSDRARRRVDAEARITRFGAMNAVRTIILRVPGIYASERLPIERLLKRTPVLRAEDDVYTNHIHADDLAALVVAALTHPDAGGIYNAADDSALHMGDWFDLLADRAGLPRPPRIPRAAARDLIPAPLLSFMSESRRMVNARIKAHLGFRLRYPTVFQGVPARIDLPAR